MSGDYIQQYGPGSIGKAQHSGSGDIVAGGKSDSSVSERLAIENLLREVQAVRQHLNDGDQVEMDAAIEEINSNPPKERFNRALQRVAGIATVIGEVGVPVISAIKALLGST